MAINAAYVKNIAPALAAIDDARVEDFIGYASPYISRTEWAEKSDFAHALYTAHLLQMTGDPASGVSSGSDTIQSKKVGDLQVTYGTSTVASAGGDSTLPLTTYGTMFLELRKSILTTLIMSR